jgi:hypothetical protein
MLSSLLAVSQTCDFESELVRATEAHAVNPKHDHRTADTIGSIRMGSGMDKIAR